MTQLNSILIGDETLTAECGAQLLARGHGIAAVVTDNPRVADWATGAGLNVLAPGAGWQRAWRAAGGLAVQHRRSADAGARRAGPARTGRNQLSRRPLPRHAGLNAPVWALLAGEPATALPGTSWKTGSIPAMCWCADFDITPEDTALTLNTKCFSAGLDSFGRFWTWWKPGSLTASLRI